MLTDHRPGGEGRGQPRFQGLFPGLGAGREKAAPPQSQGKVPGNEVWEERAALVLDFGQYEALIRGKALIQGFTVHVRSRFVFYF